MGKERRRMKLVTYEVGQGTRHGVVRGAEGAETVVDLGPGDLLGFFEGGPDAIARARQATGEGRQLAGVHVLAPLRRPPKLLAMAANYQDHIAEAGMPRVNKERIAPKLFLKPSSSILGPGEPLHLPAVSPEVDWELELAVVIGRRCRHVPV